MRYTTKQLASVVIDLIEKEDLNVEDVSNGCVRLLAEQHELQRMHDVLGAIEQIWRERHGAATIMIETAHPLNETLRKHLIKLGEGAEMREVVNEAFIGGARLTIDDRVIDGTVTTALEQLRRTLYGN